MFLSLSFSNFSIKDWPRILEIKKDILPPIKAPTLVYKNPPPSPNILPPKIASTESGKKVNGTKAKAII